MIHAVTECGPWIDLDQVHAVQVTRRRDGDPGCTVLFASGALLSFPADGDGGHSLADAWIEHRRRQDDPDAEPIRQAL